MICGQPSVSGQDFASMHAEDDGCVVVSAGLCCFENLSREQSNAGDSSDVVDVEGLVLCLYIPWNITPGPTMWIEYRSHVLRACPV